MNTNPRWILVLICLTYSAAVGQNPTKPVATQTASKPTGSAMAHEKAQADKVGEAALKKIKTAYQNGQFKDAGDRLNRLVKQSSTKSSTPSTLEEALVLLADVELRLNHVDLALSAIARFQRFFPVSSQLPRINYYHGQALLRQGKNAAAAKAFSTAATQATNQGLYSASSSGLWHILDGGGLSIEEMEGTLDLLAGDPILQAGLMERIGDQYLREGRYQAARNTFEEWLDRFPKSGDAARIKSKLKQSKDSPQQNRTVLLMAPMTGEFQEIGKAVKEGAFLDIDENNARGMGGRIDTRILDDQGNLIDPQRNSALGQPEDMGPGEPMVEGDGGLVTVPPAANDDFLDKATGKRAVP